MSNCYYSNLEAWLVENMAPNQRIMVNRYIYDEHRDLLRNLFDECFVVSYNEEFYKFLGKFTTALIHINDEFVGAFAFFGHAAPLRCSLKVSRRLSSLFAPRASCLYLSEIAVRQNFRNLGLGSLIIEQWIKYYNDTVDIFYCHVKCNNEAAIRFYERHQFIQCSVERGVYNSSDCHDAFVMVLNTRPSIYNVKKKITARFMEWVSD
ncbi:hypothetical protein PCE1_004238 [Barthelona sp. PCE]